MYSEYFFLFIFFFFVFLGCIFHVFLLFYTRTMNIHKKYNRTRSHMCDIKFLRTVVYSTVERETSKTILSARELLHNNKIFHMTLNNRMHKRKRGRKKVCIHIVCVSAMNMDKWLYTSNGKRVWWILSPSVSLFLPLDAFVLKPLHLIVVL